MLETLPVILPRGRILTNRSNGTTEPPLQHSKILYATELDNFVHQLYLSGEAMPAALVSGARDSPRWRTETPVKTEDIRLTDKQVESLLSSEKNRIRRLHPGLIDSPTVIDPDCENKAM